MKRYHKLEDGEVRLLKAHTPGIVDHKLACCDCGLVHKMRLEMRGKDAIELTAWRDRRATAAKRRSRVLLRAGNAPAKTHKSPGK